MKVALKAANGLYVCAEEGGGIDPRAAGGVTALRANRHAIGPWETFELTYLNSDGFVALKTNKGTYVTAEGAGGSFLRTDTIGVGPWEIFHLHNGALRCWDGWHYVCAEIGSSDPVVNATRTAVGPWETFTVEPLDTTPVLDRTKWKGSFCIPDALPGIPYGDGKRLWTPAYGCYDDLWRTQIRQAYKARGYTHFPYNCAGLPYGSDYPELADDSERVGRDLTELLADGILPVVCATDDRNRSGLCKSFVDRGADIVLAFPMWEMNGVLNNDETLMKNLIAATINAVPQAHVYLHFTPGHGSITADEAGGWKWCQGMGTKGLLAQGDNRFAAETPTLGGEGLQSTAIRLAGRTDLGAPASWAGLNQLTVKFEYGIYDMYHGNVSEVATRDYTTAFLSHAPQVVGYCDGGR